MKEIPESEIQRNFSLTQAKNAAKLWRRISLIFALEFPGKVAATNFTKNPPHFHEGRNIMLSPQNPGTGGPPNLVRPKIASKCKNNLTRLFFVLVLKGIFGLGKRKHTPPCSSAELFFTENDGGHRGKILVVDMAFLVFIGFLYPPPAWKVFLWGQKSSPKNFLSVVVVYAFLFSVWRFVYSLRKLRITSKVSLRVLGSLIWQGVTLTKFQWIVWGSCRDAW